jgi:glycosyltransferase involved in cell wall biosynthesis
MTAPLNVFTVVPPLHTASFYYRLQVVVNTVRDLGLPAQTVIDTQNANVSQEERHRMFCEADIVLVYQPVGEGALENIRHLEQFLPSKRDGTWKWPPTVIIETDDNIFNVSPLNQAYRSLGIRDMNGVDIPLGHHIGVASEGEKKVLWADGENGFSIARNRHTIESYRRLINTVDGISCSTQPVADVVARETTPRRIRVFPNLVRFNDYEQVDLASHPDKVKILWQGGIAHYEDWYPLRSALGNITKKYPQVEWVIWGAQFPWVNELIPAHRFSFQSWCNYPEYKLRLAMIGHDIALAPLTPNRFNDCRSAIKWYEASVLKQDIATLAQNSASYQREMVDGETGLLFNNPQEFEDKLSLLIENETERKRLGRNAKDWVHENRDAMKEVPKIVQWWEQLREERKLEQPRVGDEEWAEIEAKDTAEREAVMAQS